MTKRRLFEDAPQIPDVVKDETATVPAGETGYWLLLTDDEIKLLATGVAPARVSQMAWEALSWKREHARNVARELAS